MCVCVCVHVCVNECVYVCICACVPGVCVCVCVCVYSWCVFVASGGSLKYTGGQHFLHGGRKLPTTA